METPWEDLVNKGSKLRTQQYLLPFIGDNDFKMYHIFDEQIMITLVTFYAPGCLLTLFECE